MRAVAIVESGDIVAGMALCLGFLRYAAALPDLSTGAQLVPCFYRFNRLVNVSGLLQIPELHGLFFVEECFRAQC